MIAEIGHFALVLTLALALVQASLPLYGAAKGNTPLIRLARPLAFGQLFFVAISFFSLMYLYVVSDFSVLNVANNSHTLKPMLYKISGVWGNHEGSILLWIVILNLFGAAVALFGGNLPEAFKARVLGVQAMIGAGFLLFSLLTSNPFARLMPVPENGAGLNPLLQDPGLAFHPPFLYLGYVGFSVAFSFSIAALIEGRVDAAWARWVRPWTLAAWCFLTIGIAMGAWWAYYELGWGGWWFWDPVENASFMPWLAGTALLHSAIVVEKRDALKSWTILLAIIAFSFSLLGTFLVRSGVLTSVHAFASDPARGIFILGFLVFVIGGSLTLYAIRAPQMKTSGLFAPISREGALVLNNLILATAAATVLLGTLYPLILDTLTGRTGTVGAPYFNATFVPLMTPLIIAMGVGPMLAWKRADLGAALERLWIAAALALFAALLGWTMIDGGPKMALLGLALGFWLLAATCLDWIERVKLFRAPLAESFARMRRLPRASWGMTIAHFGFAVVVLAITVTKSFEVELQTVAHPGETLKLGGYSVIFNRVEPVAGPNYTAVRGVFTVMRGSDLVTTMTPESRSYPTPPMQTTETAVHTTPVGDLYAVIGETDGRGGWAVRLYRKPVIIWLWAGAMIMAFGGAVSLSDRRHRVGAPVRQKSQTVPGGGPLAKAIKA
jgi:cytochrome c-type biogenesis protein CcmF